MSYYKNTSHISYEFCKALVNTWNHNNIWVPHNLIENYNGPYFHPWFSAQMQQKMSNFCKEQTQTIKNELFTTM